jgi:hypothetical protein
MPNAGPQAPPIAGATEERTLLAVACRPWLGGHWRRVRHWPPYLSLSSHDIFRAGQSHRYRSVPRLVRDVDIEERLALLGLDDVERTLKGSG